MLGHSKHWDLTGVGFKFERCFFGIYFYRRTICQKWSPQMTEVDYERGIRIWHIRFAVISTVKHFHDGREPKEVRGEF